MSVHAPTPWLIAQPRPHSRLRLFCFAYAGGSASVFHGWQAALDPSIEVCAVQLPGRGARMAEAPIMSMPALLQQIAPLIARRNDRPFAFFGHSVGALIAFELARYLRLHGINGPARLIVSGCQAPQHRSPSKQYHTLADDALIDVLRDYNGTPPQVLQSRELMELVLPTIRADFSLAENYRYRTGPLLNLPISVFAGERDDNRGEGQVDGWSRETSQDCRVVWFDGGHFFIDSQRSQVLEQVGIELAELSGRMSA
ncbi:MULTISPECIES: thioesterase II family protein [Lysobacter]|uniref:thioesterase II family protein n=1 Tax=Lysobacter TaxID=68 RepID=UPI001F243CF7|nr:MULTISPECIES: alpha/beta fold hydrolase [Lysobacter]UJB20532.1 alpha/beta fold hydrolase [Lysobacter capsici]UJQ30354.1 alpha/beta fold hydrolase [Lysobacter gummosus]